MKQRYSQLVLLILLIFSMTSAAPSLQYRADFDFIMQSLKDSAYYLALNGPSDSSLQRWGLRAFEGQSDAIFKMQDDKGNTLLHAAIESQNDQHVYDSSDDRVEITRIEVIDEILKQFPAALDIENREGASPFVYALKKKRDSVAAYLLSKNKKPSEERARIFLQAAARDNLIEVAKYVIEKCGVSVNTTVKVDDTTSTMLDYAVSKNADKVAAYLIDKGAALTTTASTTLHLVARHLNNGTSIINTILTSKPELLNAQDNDGYTPFMRAVQAGQESTMKYLLTKGGLDLVKKDNESQRNALAWAIHYNRPVNIIISILDKNSHLLNETSEQGEGEQSLLHEAIGMKRQDTESEKDQCNSVGIVRELIRRKPDFPSLKDGKGRTPLQCAQELSISDKSIMKILENPEIVTVLPKVTIHPLINAFLKNTTPNNEESPTQTPATSLSSPTTNVSDDTSPSHNVKGQKKESARGLKNIAVDGSASSNSGLLPPPLAKNVKQPQPVVASENTNQPHRPAVSSKWEDMVKAFMGVLLGIGIGFSIKKMITRKTESAETLEKAQDDYREDVIGVVR